MSAGSHIEPWRPTALACGWASSRLTKATSCLSRVSQLRDRRIQYIALEGQSLLMHDRIESQPDCHQHHGNQLQTGSEERERHVIDVSVLQPVTDDRNATCDSGQNKHQR